ATIELYKALEKNANFPEANYFLGLLYEDREHWEEAANTLDKVVTVNAEHLPAKLHLARARTENSDYYSAIAVLEQFADVLKPENNFTEKLRAIRSNLQKRPSDLGQAEAIRRDVKERLKGLIDEADDLLEATPESYQSATVSRGIKDPLIFNELAELYFDQEQTDHALGVLEQLL